MMNTLEQKHDVRMTAVEEDPHLSFVKDSIRRQQIENADPVFLLMQIRRMGENPQQLQVKQALDSRIHALHTSMHAHYVQPWQKLNDHDND